jgi:sugar O-acyltransferase (sialic acid O-acetyltransferase NeuD family)
MSTPVVILGSGAHGVDILDSLLELGDAFRPVGFLDDRAGPEVHGFPVLGGLSRAGSLDREIRFVTAIGSVTNYRAKPALIEGLGLERERFISVIHPSASLSQWAQVGLGTVVLQQCTLSAGCRLGDHGLLLPGCRISHDTVVEDYNTLATGVILSGYVRVERNCYLGAGVLVRERLCLGEGCLVGMGGVVIRSVEPGQRVAGNPARPLKAQPG